MRIYRAADWPILSVAADFPENLLLELFGFGRSGAAAGLGRPRRVSVGAPLAAEALERLGEIEGLGAEEREDGGHVLAVAEALLEEALHAAEAEGGEEGVGEVLVVGFGDPLGAGDSGVATVLPPITTGLGVLLVLTTGVATVTFFTTLTRVEPR